MYLDLGHRGSKMREECGDFFRPRKEAQPSHSKRGRRGGGGGGGGDDGTAGEGEQAGGVAGVGD